MASEAAGAGGRRPNPSRGETAATEREEAAAEAREEVYLSAGARNPSGPGRIQWAWIICSN